MSSSTAFLEVVSSKTRFSNASIGDAVFYTTNPNKSIHLGTLLGSNSALTIQGSNVTINGSLAVNGSTITNGGTTSNSNAYGSDIFIAAASRTAASPSFTFSNDTDTGMYTPADNVIGFACSASNMFTISPTVIQANTTMNMRHMDVRGQLRIGSATTPFAPMPDQGNPTSVTTHTISATALWSLTTVTPTQVSHLIPQSSGDYSIQAAASFSSSSSIVPLSIWQPGSSSITIPISGVYTITYSIATDTYASISSYLKQASSQFASASHTGTYNISAAHTSYFTSNQVLSWHISSSAPLKASDTYLSLTLLPQSEQNTDIAIISVVGLWYLTATTGLNGLQLANAYTHDLLRSHSSHTINASSMFATSSNIVVPVRGIYTIAYTIVTEEQTSISAYLINAATQNKYAQSSTTGTNSTTASHTSLFEANTFLNWHAHTNGSGAIASQTYLTVTLVNTL